MLVVLASPRDHLARALVERWRAEGAALLTPHDLSRPGWIYDPVSPDDGFAVVSGERVPVRAVAGVLCRLPTVFEGDLPEIVAADRPYVAAEMTAFLLAWLSTLPGPVVNRPRPPSLAGPGWRWVQWRHAAASAGFAVAPLARDVAGGSEVRTAVVVAGRCVRSVAPGVDESVLRLAKRAQVELLAVHVREDGEAPLFAGADPWPDPSQPGVEEALRDAFARTRS